jgi:hypothetical protein
MSAGGERQPGNCKAHNRPCCYECLQKSAAWIMQGLIDFAGPPLPTQKTKWENEVSRAMMFIIEASI